MNPRNILRNNSTIEFEVARQIPNQQHPEPYILLGSPPNFPQQNAHQIIPSGSLNTIDSHRLPENQDATALYRLPHYPHPVHPVGNLEPGIPTPPNFYNPYMNPASGGMMFSGPLNHSSMDQLPSSSSNFGASSSHVSGYGMNGFASDGFQGLSKRNGPEGFMGNAQYFNSSSASTASVPPMNVCHIEAACNPMPQFRGNYVGPSFQPPGVTWCERQPNGVGDRSTLPPFSYPPVSPYFEVNNVNGNSSEIGNAGPQRFHDGASTSQGSLNLLPYTPMLHPTPNIHPQNIQPGSRYNLNYPPPIATTSSRHPVNHMQYANINHPQQVPEAVPPPPGIRIYRSHRRSGASEGVHRHRNFPHLRLLQEEGVAILEFSGHHEMSGAIDHHRDMRLDIDYMSYEELLALSEQIGDVNTGLSEAAVNAHLKTRIHVSSCGTINLEELPCIDDKKDSCVICQDEYEDNDNIGTLDCGHEYHVGCLKKWLLVKNACPICKSAALNVEHKKSE